MEDIYTIKVRSNPDPRGLYPSERRYSASTVLGLGVVHLALAVTILLLASLSLSSYGGKSPDSSSVVKINTTAVNRTLEDIRNDDVLFLDEEEEYEKEATIDGESYTQFVALTLAPCIMSLGALAAGITGILAWKRWYIDHYISWFFFMSSISTLTSLACLTVTGLTIGMENNQFPNGNTFIFSFTDSKVFVNKVDEQNSVQDKIGRASNMRLVLAINVLIASILEFIWSVLSTKISWKGMRNNYPEDMIVRGKLQVNTVHKGNKKKAVAPDILNHHPKKRKFAKYFPKKESNILPKMESNTEYQERVNKFLSSEPRN